MRGTTLIANQQESGKVWGSRPLFSQIVSVIPNIVTVAKPGYAPVLETGGL